MNGALMLARSRRSVVVIDSGTPRNAPAEGIHGLLGNEGTPPAQLLARGRGEVRQYGGLIVSGQVAAARPASTADDGDPCFTVELNDGRTVTARRLLLATGVRDELPAIAGLATHWGHSLVHCPYCHGWEVRGEPIGIIARGPSSEHQALLFRQLSDDIIYFTQGTELGDQARARFAALGIRVVETRVEEVLAAADGGIAAVHLAGGERVERRILTVATTLEPRLEGLEELGLETEDLPMGMGRRIATQTGGVTAVPGVWAAGNLAEPMAQVGASAAGGAFAGSHLNAALVMADAEAAVRAAAPAESVRTSAPVEAGTR